MMPEWFKGEDLRSSEQLFAWVQIPLMESHHTSHSWHVIVHLFVTIRIRCNVYKSEIYVVVIF